MPHNPIIKSIYVDDGGELSIEYDLGKITIWHQNWQTNGEANPVNLTPLQAIGLASLLLDTAFPVIHQADRAAFRVPIQDEVES